MSFEPMTVQQTRIRPFENSTAIHPQRIPGSNTQHEKMIPELPHNRFLSCQEVADLLKVSRRTLCNWAAWKTIPAFKIGRQWRFRAADITAWIKRHSTATSAVSNIIVCPKICNLVRASFPGRVRNKNISKL
jgi:excisionase family DNA binding protein